MIKDVANKLKSALELIYINSNGSGIITHLSGLVRVKELPPQAGAKDKIKIPIPLEDEEIKDCSELQAINKLVPEETKRCIVYFEGETAKFVQRMGSKVNWTTNLSLICWYNSDMFNDVDNLQTLLISMFSETVGSVKTKDEELAIKSVELIGVNESVNIFGKYTYSDMYSNFLLHPFGFFSINLKINFTTNEKTSCITPISSVSIIAPC